MLNTVLADAVLLTLCWRSFVRTLLGTQSLEFAFCNQGFHSFASKRTLVHLAANGSNEPKLPDAALCLNGGFSHFMSVLLTMASLDLLWRRNVWQHRDQPTGWHQICCNPNNHVAFFVACIDVRVGCSHL